MLWSSLQSRSLIPKSSSNSTGTSSKGGGLPPELGVQLAAAEFCASLSFDVLREGSGTPLARALAAHYGTHAAHRGLARPLGPCYRPARMAAAGTHSGRARHMWRAGAVAERWCRSCGLPQSKEYGTLVVVPASPLVRRAFRWFGRRRRAVPHRLVGKGRRSLGRARRPQAVQQLRAPVRVCAACFTAAMGAAHTKLFLGEDSTEKDVFPELKENRRLKTGRLFTRLCKVVARVKARRKRHVSAKLKARRAARKASKLGTVGSSALAASLVSQLAAVTSKQQQLSVGKEAAKPGDAHRANKALLELVPKGSHRQQQRQRKEKAGVTGGATAASVSAVTPAAPLGIPTGPLRKGGQKQSGGGDDSKKAKSAEKVKDMMKNLGF